jgi:hypothetical protein
MSRTEERLARIEQVIEDFIDPAWHHRTLNSDKLCGIDAVLDAQEEEMDYKERVFKEHNELLERYNRLKNFIEEGPFEENTSIVEGRLLTRQLHCMGEYLEILCSRIDLWTVGTPL